MYFSHVLGQHCEFEIIVFSYMYFMDLFIPPPLPLKSKKKISHNMYSPHDVFLHVHVYIVLLFLIMYQFDTNGNAEDGCEAGCPTFATTSCTACSDAGTCTAIAACVTNTFDTNGDAVDGCETGCADVAGGTCIACITAVTSGCTAVTCETGKGNADNDATNGCETNLLPNGCATGWSSRNCGTGLNKAVSDWIAGGTLKDAVVAHYGEIEIWDTSEVTNLAYVFSEKTTFNADISKWIVSKVTNMQSSKTFVANC